MIRLLEKLSLWCFQLVEKYYTRAFGAENPFFQLGALSFFLFWIVTVSGVYLFIFFDTSITGAYESVEYITTTQWYLGGIMRSLHRYASDGLAITVTLHLVREFSKGRFRGGRAFSWISGIPLLWFLFAASIGGLWLVWDELALYVAMVTTEWFDWLPIITEPLARNFLSEKTLSDRLFSLLIFLHIAIPLFMLGAMFVHIKRLKDSKTSVDRTMAIWVLGFLLILSVVKPVVSMGPADLSQSPQMLRLDWFYLNLYPLIEHWGPGQVWFLLIGLSTLLVALPWLSPVRKSKKQVAIVSPDNCNGCGWCYQDCPYEAITMVVHEAKPGRMQAKVNPDLCTGCAICSGSCPSATPFRHVDELVSGIDIPGRSIETLKTEAEEKLNQLAATTGKGTIVFGCKHANDIDVQSTAGIVGITLPCIAQLPPSFINYLVRREEVAGIFITGCSPADCFARLGSTWMEQRLVGERMPHLRKSTDAHLIKLYWAGPGERQELQARIESFHKEIIRGCGQLPVEQGV